MTEDKLNPSTPYYCKVENNSKSPSLATTPGENNNQKQAMNTAWSDFPQLTHLPFQKAQ